MAGLTPKAVREALAAQIAGNVQRGIGMHAYAPLIDTEEAPAYPAGIIGHAQEGTDYALTFGPDGIAEMHLEISFYTHSADGKSAEQALDDLIAAGDGAGSSIYDALMADVTLGGIVRTLRVVNFRPPRSLGNGKWGASYIIAIYQARS